MTKLIPLFLILASCSHVLPPEPTLLPTPPNWAKSTFNVCLTPTMSKDWNRSARAATSLFNTYARQTLLVNATSKCDILVTEGEEVWNGTRLEGFVITNEAYSEQDYAAETYFDATQPKCYVVWRSKIADERTAMFVFMHEFGHCLGLSHDTFTRSVMFVRVMDFADNFPGPMLTDADAAALRKRY